MVEAEGRGAQRAGHPNLSTMNRPQVGVGGHRGPDGHSGASSVNVQLITATSECPSKLGADEVADDGSTTLFTRFIPLSLKLVLQAVNRILH